MENTSTSRWGRYGRRLVAGVLFVVLFGAGYLVRGMLSGLAESVEPDHAQTAPQEEASLWTCAMHPQIRQPRPGKCPLCGMKLVPVKSSAGGLRQITLSPEVRKLMDIRTVPVERRYVTATVRMVGKVAYDETRLGYITAWVAGRLDRLYVDYTGVTVKKGDHMIYIYSPELYSAENELIQALKSGAPYGGVDLVESTREKLRLLGMTPEQIKEIERRRKPSDHMTIYAPSSGIVIHKTRNAGDYVKVGERIYTIADLSHVWVLLDAYESDLPWIRYGQEVSFTTEAYPGETFVGRVAFIDPVLNDRTRTVKVRVNVPNLQGKLKPDMFVSGVLHSRVAAGGRVVDPGLAGKWISPMHPEVVKDQPGKCDICGMPLVRAEELGYVSARERETEPLVIPRSAALVTGTRAIVYVALPGRKQPTYEGREIVLGPRAGDYYLVRSGLKEGDLVVTNGNFKIDSALQIQAKPSMMTPEGGGGSGHDHGGHGSPAGKKETPGQHVMKVPDAFRHQLHRLDEASQGVATAVEAADLVKTRAAFVAFGKALAAVDAKLVKDHPRMLWDEFAMLLHNDVVEGQDVRELAEAKRVLGLLQDHMRRVRERLGTGHTGHGAHEGHASLPETPIAFQRQAGKLLDAYLALQQALAGDNLGRAQEGIKRLQTALAALNAEVLPELTREAWKKEKVNLDAIVRRLAGAKDLKALRGEFSPLSGVMAVVVRTFGVGDAGPVYQLHCEMALGGRGANWLQQDEKPRNPYFGAAMLECAGEPVKIAGPKHAAPKGHGQKEGHNHD
jgi:membrane fusion protein, copper/silver efflux system